MIDHSIGRIKHEGTRGNVLNTRVFACPVSLVRSLASLHTLKFISTLDDCGGLALPDPQ